MAAEIGDRAALDIYLFLLRHTAAECARLTAVDKLVYFSEHHGDGSIWNRDTFQYRLQEGEDLGLRMQQAFADAFKSGYSEVILIGSDLPDLSAPMLEEAYKSLAKAEAVLGPAKDGGYYLLGMKRLIPELFRNKEWGTHTVLKNTLEDLKGVKTSLLSVQNDIDRYEDIEGNPVFNAFIKNK